MFSMRSLMLLIPALPLAASLVTALLGARVLRKASHWPVILGCLGSFVCSVMLLLSVRAEMASDPASARAEETVATTPVLGGYAHTETLWTWACVDNAYPQARHPVAAGAKEVASRDFQIDVTLRADPLTCLMLCMVTFIGSLVAIYAAGYMKGDRGYWRFFAYVAIFVFSMTMLVSVSNFLLLFVFWEAVGACSYLLIGFWYEKPSAAAAGKKAFLVNRVGDFGFALALFLIWTTYGTWNFHDMPGVPGVLGELRLASGAFIGGGLGLAICLLLMLGACGKSAQFPLHVWLPDAMEGPTPVSALIHAATMVTAGVYMVTRCTPLFIVSPTAQLTVACIGGFTALLAGLIAITQHDLKRVLAYSTISQLGYMFLALGTGTLAGIAAGMFHLMTHAFFKALLFLGSGSVMHAMGNVVDMRRFGGLRKIMPMTHWTFLAGCLALAGVFPLAGFWSKDAILASVKDQAMAMQTALHTRDSGMDHASTDASGFDAGAPIQLATHHVLQDADVRLATLSTARDRSVRTVADVSRATHESGEHSGGEHGVTTSHLRRHSDQQLAWGARVYQGLYYAGLFTAFLTAIYTFRAFFLTFYGDLEVPHQAGDHAHESPPAMWIPLVILAVFAVGVGFVLKSAHVFDGWLVQTPSLATALLQATPAPGHFHMDVAILSTVIAIVGIAIAAFLYLGNQREAASIARVLDAPATGQPYRWSLNRFYLDEIYHVALVKPLEWLAAALYLADRKIIDGAVNLAGWLPKAAGGMLRGMQMGLIPFYGLAMVLGVLTLLAARVLWGEQ